MKNVYKGFQTSKTAVPKVHEAAINKSYSRYHGGGLRMLRPRLDVTMKLPKKAPKMPGRNPGIK